MYLFLETISVKDGIILNISDHQERMDRTILYFYNGSQKAPCLSSCLRVPEMAQQGWYKCRVIYDKKIVEITWEPYHIKTFSSISLVSADHLDYSWKYADRKEFGNIIQKSQAAEVIIVKNGYVTDGSYANLLFRKEDEWFTPDTPLLAGTQRKRLLGSGLIHEATIRVEDLTDYDRIKWINAFLDMETGPEWPVNKVEYNTTKAGS